VVDTQGAIAELEGEPPTTVTWIEDRAGEDVPSVEPSLLPPDTFCPSPMPFPSPLFTTLVLSALSEECDKARLVGELKAAVGTEVARLSSADS